MKILSGDEFGLIKLINTKTKKVETQFGEINMNHEIVGMIRSPTSFTNESDINKMNLYITEKKASYVLDWENQVWKSNYQSDSASFTSSLLKTSETNNILINSTDNSDIVFWNYDYNDEYLGTTTITPIENPNVNWRIKMSRVCDSIVKENFYILYENTPWLLYNIESKKVEFKAKNLPHDELGLRIPIYDTFTAEVKDNPRMVYVSTGYGDIRLYDKKASPKPILNKNVSQNKINKIWLANDNNGLVYCDTKGFCMMWDIRKGLAPIKNFRGNSGSVRDIIEVKDKNSIVLGGVDRYVKWYDYKMGDNDSWFVKNRITKWMWVAVSGEDSEEEEQSSDEEGEEIHDSEFDDLEDEENEDEENEDEEEQEENENSQEEESEEDVQPIRKKRRIE